MGKSNIYYKKDKKMSVYKAHQAENELGYTETTYYTPVSPSPLWCYTKQLSQQQMFQAHYYGVDETRLFVLNYRDDVAVYDRVLYNDKWYSVTRVDTYEDYRGELFVYVNDARGEERPSDDELKPYGYTE